MSSITETRPDGRAVCRDIVSWLTGDSHGLDLSWLCIRHSGRWEPRVLALLNELADSRLAYPDPVSGLRFYGHVDAIRLGLERLRLPDDVLDIRYVRPGR